MWSTILSFFHNSTWTQLIDYTVFGLVARYFPSYTAVKAMFSQKA